MMTALLAGLSAPGRPKEDLIHEIALWTPVHGRQRKGGQTTYTMHVLPLDSAMELTTRERRALLKNAQLGEKL